MDSTCVESAMQQLSDLLTLQRLTLPVKQRVQTLQLELKFIRLFFSCLSKWKDADKSTVAHLGSLQLDLAAAGHGIYEAGYFAILGIDVKNWEVLTFNLLEKVGLFKPEIRKVCVDSFDCPLQSKPSSNAHGILEFVESILKNLEDLSRLKGDGVIQVKKRIQVLEGKLRFLKNFLDFAAKYCNGHHNLEDFLMKVQSWANNAACVTLLYWADGSDVVVDLPPPMNVMLQKIMPCTPEVAEMYLELMKCSKSSQSDTLLKGKLVVGFVDFLLENPMDALTDHVEILREGIMFCLSFLMDPRVGSAEEVGNVMSGEVNEIITDLTRLICSPSTDDRKDGSILLSDLLQKINGVQAEVRELYVRQPDSSDSGFPKIIGMGFIDNILDDLEIMKCDGKCIPFPKLKVGKIHEELKSCRQNLKDIAEPQNHLWRRILNVAYQAEGVISSCLRADCHIWFNMARLVNVLEELKHINAEVRNNKTLSTGQPSAQMNSTRIQSSEGDISKAAEIVGFQEEAEAIIQKLIAGPQRLHLVSIEGMAGVGKTTLAQKVFNDPLVQSQFTKCVWCLVSKVYRRRDLLLHILGQIVNDGQLSNKSDDDLAEMLRKSLRVEKYLIVMDNIWDIEAWNAVKDSLPDDEKGNRILFTTQNCDLASQTKPKCEKYPIGLLPPEKYWPFLQEKLFGQDACPDELVDTGKQIARSCKGLRLALVVIAGLLQDKKTNLDWWKRIGENLASGTDDKGYMKALEVSYKHLPDSLKPCFLYLGAFGEGEVITVRKLATLWIAEGFVERNTMKSSEIKAKENLEKLINRSLVIATKRSSNGGIKACRVHDLLRKLSAEQSMEERFLHALHQKAKEESSVHTLHQKAEEERFSDTLHAISDVSTQSLKWIDYDHYRLCIYTEWETLIGSIPTSSKARSFLLFASSRWNPSSSDSISQLFHCFKLLKVLDMESIHLECSFPEEILSAVQLRYLAIRGDMTDIPSSVTNLWNLESLIVRTSESFVRLPIIIWKIKRLKHVDISPRAIISFSDVELEELPLSQLADIEAFSCLSLYHGEDTEKLLPKRLSGLRRLRCVFLESQGNTWKPIKFPNLNSLNELESLKVSTYASDRQVFYSWMRIQFQGFNLPSSLKKLTLYSFGLPWRQISTIGRLQNLEVLKLRDDAFRGKRWDMEDEGFPNLKFLELSNLNLEKWIVSYDTFTNLETLVIKDCDGLEEIPPEFGEISTMKTIELRCSSADVRNSATKVHDKQREEGQNAEFKVIQL